MGTVAHPQPVLWPDEIDEIFVGDLVVAVGMPTPRGGVALVNVIPIGLRDRSEGTVGFTTSLGFGRKLERIASDPRIAVAYHTRQHSHTDRPGYVLVQGTASIQQIGSRAWLAKQASKYDDQLVAGRLWDWWLKVYYWDRVLVTVKAQRILWWPQGRLTEDPIVLGEPLPAAVSPLQDPPLQACVPRVRPRGLARAARRGQLLLGVLLADSMPLILPVGLADLDHGRARLAVTSSLLPPGSRRAGLLAHDFNPRLIGLWTASHTGWLENEVEPIWTAHTRHFFYGPPVRSLLLFGNGLAARLGYRDAIRKGRHLILQHAQGAPPMETEPQAAPRSAVSS